MQREIWKDVPNYEGFYQVSNLGNVKSLKRRNEKLLVQLDNGRGYLCVRLWKDLKGKTFRIHKLVAISFLNHTPCGMNLIVDHINDIKTDNRVENLQIVTQRENSYKTQGKYTSKYKGVSWNKKSNKWMSQININGKAKYLGCFFNEEEAHQAYINKLKELEHE